MSDDWSDRQLIIYSYVSILLSQINRYFKSEIKNRRNDFMDLMIIILITLLERGIKIKVQSPRYKMQ